MSTSPISLLQVRLGENHKVAEQLGRFTAFSLQPSILRLPQFIDLQCRLACLHEYVLKNDCGGGMLIQGASGVGKSTAIQAYASLMPRDDTGEVSKVRLLMIQMPSAPSVKTITEALLHELGYRRYRSQDAERKALILREMITTCGVELIVIENFQHIENVVSAREARRCVDWLKSLADTRKLGLVLVGLPGIDGAIGIRADIERRFAHRLYMWPFSLDIEREWDTYRSILKAFQKELPLPVETPLHEANLARRIWFASYGLIDRTQRLLEAAVQVAQEFAVVQLTPPLLAEAFRRSIWCACPDRLNPFSEVVNLRLLHNKGEPYHLTRPHCQRVVSSRGTDSFVILSGDDK